MNARDMAYKFLSLPHHIRMEIFDDWMGETDKEGKPDGELFQLLFAAVVSSGRTVEFAQKVDEAYLKYA